jgi:glycosyltransferase involved in cell wall biosynthesis
MFEQAETVGARGRLASLKVACYFDAGNPGGSSASLATLLGALDPSIDATLVGTSDSMVRSVASARPGMSMRVLAPVRSKFDLARIGAHIRAVRDLRPDILHVNLDNPWTSQYGLLAGAVTRTATVAVLHGRTPAWRRRQAWLVRLVARRVDAYVAVSHDAARFAEEVLHRPPRSVRVIYNGAPVPERSAPPRAPGPPVVGAVGRLSPEKGLEVLVRAVRTLPGCRLVLVGEGPERPRLEQLVRDLELAERVQFAGWVDAPWTAQWAFDVVAMPSFTEAFPLVIVEAMLAGMPVVASSVGGIPEIVVDGDTGLLVPPNDVEALASSLGELVDDAERRVAMGARCRSVAQHRFTADVMAANFESLYRELTA